MIHHLISDKTKVIMYAKANVRMFFACMDIEGKFATGNNGNRRDEVWEKTIMIRMGSSPTAPE